MAMGSMPWGESVRRKIFSIRQRVLDATFSISENAPCAGARCLIGDDPRFDFGRMSCEGLLATEHSPSSLCRGNVRMPPWMASEGFATLATPIRPPYALPFPF